MNCNSTHRALIACWCCFLRRCDDTVVGPLTHLSLPAFVSIKLTKGLCKCVCGQRKHSDTDLTCKKGNWYWTEGLKWHRHVFESRILARRHLNKRFVTSLQQPGIIVKAHQSSLTFFDSLPARNVQSIVPIIKNKQNNEALSLMPHHLKTETPTYH